MQYVIIPVTPYQQNCTLLICPETHKAAVVDPGGDIDLILTALQNNNATLQKIFLTHGHLDHISATSELSKMFTIPVLGPHQDDLFWIESLPSQCKSMGFPICDAFIPTQWLKQGDKVSFGAQTLDVLHCPGHTPGHVVFYHPQKQLALVGDVIFKDSIGRTDFPKGDYKTLINSIKNKLLPLGDAVEFIPGHGPMSTFGEEKRHNPFIQER